jgi:hypothetical protein
MAADSTRIDLYLKWLASMQLVSFIYEVQSIHEAFSDAKTVDSSNPYNHLRLDAIDKVNVRGEDTEATTISLQFYKLSQKSRAQATAVNSSPISKDSLISVGQWVAVSRCRDQKMHRGWVAHSCIGKVTRIQIAPFHVEVEVFQTDGISKAVQLSILKEKRYFWRLDRIANVQVHVRVIKAISEDNKKDPSLMRVLTDSVFETKAGDWNSNNNPMDRLDNVIKNANQLYTEPSVPLPIHNTLNSSQQQAVDNSFKCPITLIQGPPGTGKYGGSHVRL